MNSTPHLSEREIDNVLIGAHTRLRAVKPAAPLIGPLLELGLALLRPAAVRAEEEQLREEVRGILARFGERRVQSASAQPRV